MNTTQMILTGLGTASLAGWSASFVLPYARQAAAKAKSLVTPGTASLDGSATERVALWEAAYHAAATPEAKAAYEAVFPTLRQGNE